MVENHRLFPLEEIPEPLFHSIAEVLSVSGQTLGQFVIIRIVDLPDERACNEFDLFVLSHPKQIRDSERYYAVFKLWFIMSILGYAFSSALSVLIYPYLAGYFLMLLVAVVVRTIFPRARQQEEFPVAAIWRAAPIARPDHSVGSR